MADRNQWLEWARELQFLSQCALTYCQDVYDIERFERIREIAAEMTSQVGQLPFEPVKDLFLSANGYQTPKLDTRAVVMRDGKLLLVREKVGTWALPGGWVDYNQTLRQNTIKETLEEAGMTVRPVRLIALMEHNLHNTLVSFHNICSAFVLCEYVGGEFVPNVETTECGFFAPDALPEPLATNKNTREQLEMCFKAAADPHWEVYFD